MSIEVDLHLVRLQIRKSFLCVTQRLLIWSNDEVTVLFLGLVPAKHDFGPGIIEADRPSFWFRGRIRGNINSMGHRVLLDDGLPPV